VHVAPPADRRRVVELRGDDLQHRGDDAAPSAIGLGHRLPGERDGGEQAGVPGAERLGRGVDAGHRAEVVVDVGRADRVLGAVAVDELEEQLTRELLAAPHEARQAGVVEGHLVHLGALAGEAQPEVGALDLHVAVAERRQPEGPVGPGVLLVPDAHEGPCQELDDDGDHAVPR
jgi:hypothetical protein